MIYEMYKLADSTECDYESYALSMTVGDLIDNSHSSKIQRLRNEIKEEGIMKFLREKIDNRTTPFLQPFILHYNGYAESKNGKFVLDSKPNYLVTIEGEDGPEERQFTFEVLDGNGRLNAMIRLSQYYVEEVVKLTRCGDPQKCKNKIYDLKIKNRTLRETRIVVQLYVNLSDFQKTQLFNSVNQGEQMAKGRLKIYDSKKIDNQLLHRYILHTESINLPYIVTPDKDVIKKESERDLYIPAVNLLALIRKLIKYSKYKNIVDVDAFIFYILDFYLLNTTSSKFFKKPYLSLFGSMVEKAIKIESSISLETLAKELFRYDYDKYENISIQLKEVRNDILELVI